MRMGDTTIDEARKLVTCSEIIDANRWRGTWHGQHYECRALPDTTYFAVGDSVYCHVLPGTSEVVAIFQGSDDFPIGGIVIWSGAIADIPSHFALCDGTVYPLATTPDLRDRFIIAASDPWEVSDNAYGGMDECDGRHEHYWGKSTDYESAHTHDVPGGSWASTGPGFLNTTDGPVASSGNHSHPYSPATTTAGTQHRHTVSGATELVGDETLDNRPPFYALAYIMRVD